MTPRERRVRAGDAPARRDGAVQGRAADVGREAPRDPALLVAAWCNVDRLSRRLLDAAETADDRLMAAVARRVLAAIYVRAFKVWLDDETPDMARTLAELDRRLQQAEQVARWIRGFGRSRPVACTADGSRGLGLSCAQ